MTEQLDQLWIWSGQKIGSNHPCSTLLRHISPSRHQQVAEPQVILTCSFHQRRLTNHPVRCIGVRICPKERRCQRQPELIANLQAQTSSRAHSNDERCLPKQIAVPDVCSSIQKNLRNFLDCASSCPGEPCLSQYVKSGLTRLISLIESMKNGPARFISLMHAASIGRIFNHRLQQCEQAIFLQGPHCFEHICFDSYLVRPLLEKCSHLWACFCKSCCTYSSSARDVHISTEVQQQAACGRIVGTSSLHKWCLTHVQICSIWVSPGFQKFARQKKSIMSAICVLRILTNASSNCQVQWRISEMVLPVHFWRLTCQDQLQDCLTCFCLSF
mmetsp:Transcript_35582/g.65895  ORF Transcript_35582/g.65895 Transcript_35582/m.65895 type:complete len:329 (-) Transcript_35582:703-1689(-)